ncbi:MAG: hypothetical protein ACYC1Z_03450 [Georgenia sp.]
MTSDQTRRVDDQLDYLEQTWPELVTTGVIPGSRRVLPSSRRRRSAEAVKQAAIDDALDMLERGKPGWVPGAARQPAPVDLDMLDTLAVVVSTTEDLVATITQTAGVERPVHVESVYEDPRPYLRTARAWLTAAQEADDRTVPWADDLLRPVVRKVATMLGEIVDGQVLDALCPWCTGRSEKRPTGGDRTLVVHAPAVTSTASRSGRAGADDGPVVVCHGTNCTPPSSSVGTWIGEQPAWPEREWDWLAKQLLAVDGDVTARAVAHDTPQATGR